MIVAITGGTGFVGRRLVQRHLARGDEVRVLSRRAPPGVGLPASLRWCLGDLAAAGDLGHFVDRADVLYHCAGELRDASRMEAVHVEGTRRLIEATSGTVRRWVQLSSVGVYGQPRDGRVTERSPLQPRGTYEITKKTSDALVQAAGLKEAFEWVILRPSIVFGEDMPNQSLYQLVRAIDRGWFFFIGKPGAAANYIQADNVAHALTMCGVMPTAKGRIYNLSDHATLEDFVGMIAAALGKPSPRFRIPEPIARATAGVGSMLSARFPLTRSRVDAMTTRVQYPIDAIQAELGYAHEVALEAGMSRLVHAWLAQQRIQLRRN